MVSMGKKQGDMHPLYTRWGRELDKTCPLAEYPRPQMKREVWQCLNGVWEYAICDGAEPEPTQYDGEITVPFSPESLLSGIMHQLLPGQTLWYRRTVRFNNMDGQRILLHFGAVDQRCTVYMNGQTAGTHEGGYWPFCLDITELVREGGNALVVAVQDDSDAGDQAYGKQKLKRGGIWYTAQSGIWQTVWAETVPREYIRNVKITPRWRDAVVDFELDWTGEAVPESCIRVFVEGKPVAEGRFDGSKATIRLPGFRSWNPDDPFLYTATIEAGQDAVETYFGMREFSTVPDVDGNPRLALNGTPIFHTGLLDQGYWSDGLYTAPSDEAMVWELTEIKRMGFNMLRKHIKIEPLRWYYHCDRLGILVWQDFVSGGRPGSAMVTQWLPYINVRMRDSRYRQFGRQSAAGRAVFEADMKRTVGLLYNAVSIAVWVPFNEGWGQFDACRITEKLRGLDATRSIDHASGWHDQQCGDFCSRHIYYKKFRMRHDPCGRVQALTEFGGYSCPAAGHMASDTLFGYKTYPDAQKMSEAVETLYQSEVIPAAKRGLSAAVYTQVSDVEDEINGLFTYDRKVTKLDVKTAQRINAALKDAGK